MERTERGLDRLTPWGIALAMVLWVACAHAAPMADPVLAWNEQTNLSIQATAMDPFNATRALALESIAVHDTLRSAQGLPGFLVRLDAPGDISQDLAVSAAAHTMLVYLFPARQAVLDALLATEQAAVPDKAKNQRSVAFGQAVAKAIVAIRDGDGWNRIVAATTGTGIGQWRPTPPRHIPALTPQWASVTPFTLVRPDQFRPPGPPAPGTPAFAEARAQTAKVGGIQSQYRTADQALAARYWSDAIGTYAPAGHWNSIANTVLQTHKRDRIGEATLLAELNVAVADAAIAMVDAKYVFNFWRPITAIHTGDATFRAGCRCWRHPTIPAISPVTLPSAARRPPS